MAKNPIKDLKNISLNNDIISINKKNILKGLNFKVIDNYGETGYMIKTSILLDGDEIPIVLLITNCKFNLLKSSVSGIVVVSKISKDDKISSKKLRNKINFNISAITLSKDKEFNISISYKGDDGVINKTFTGKDSIENVLNYIKDKLI